MPILQGMTVWTLRPRARSRRRAIAVALVLAALTTGSISGPASADGPDDQIAAALAASVEGLDAELAQAVLDLQATQARLPVVEAELAAAQADLDRTQREAALVAVRLEDAVAQDATLAAAIATDRENAEQLRAAVGQFARRAYKGETGASSLALVLDAKNTQDFLDQYGLISTALRTQTQALAELDQLEAANRNSRARLTAVRAKVVTLKAEADQQVADADAARLAAQDAQAEIVALIADQTAKQALIAEKRAQAEADEAKFDAERAGIASDLAGIVAARRAAGLTPSSVGSLAGALFGNPTAINPMRVSSEYGMRVNPVSGIYKLHAGIDLQAACNTPVYAARAGTLLWTRPDVDGLGNRVMISHGFVSGVLLMTAYYHLTQYVVSPGQKVAQGQVIGYSGATGNATGCHLHFEVWENGATVNPRSTLGL